MSKDNFSRNVAIETCCGAEDSKRQPDTETHPVSATRQIGKIAEQHKEGLREHWDLLVALAILITLLMLEYGFNFTLARIPSLFINLSAWPLAGYKVLRLAWRKCKRGDFFNEFLLMSVATIGAFLIGEYEEGVAVMVFYAIGDWFQEAAVDKANEVLRHY